MLLFFSEVNCWIFVLNDNVPHERHFFPELGKDRNRIRGFLELKPDGLGSRGGIECQLFQGNHLVVPNCFVDLL